MSQECLNARKRGLRCVTWIALRGYVDCAIIYGAMQVALRKQSAFMRTPISKGSDGLNGRKRMQM